MAILPYDVQADWTAPRRPIWRSSDTRTAADIQADFLAHLHSEGFAPVGPIQHGKIVPLRLATDKPKKHSAWYIYFEHITDDGRIFASAVYQDWHESHTRSWHSRATSQMSEAERRFRENAIADAQAAAEVERERIQAEAAEKCSKIYFAAQPVESHPYLTAKGIKPLGEVRESRGNLLIPIRVAGQLTSLQFIEPTPANESWVKLFKRGGRIKGGYFVINGALPSYVCEGYATGASLHEATGRKVWVAFNAGNLFEVATHAHREDDGAIIIAGDDDTAKPVNTGRSAATQAANALGVPVVFPTVPTDFNDQHAKNGLADLTEHLLKKRRAYKQPQQHTFTDAPPMPQMLDEIAAYYRATDHCEQPLFAIQTALATASILCARHYKTNNDNFSSLYFLNMTRSGTGKEHIKHTIEGILNQSGYGRLIAGDGYTSGGAVFSALLDRPRHVSVVDEFSHYVRAANSKADANGKDAKSQLMQAFGRCHGIMRPKSYSGMTLTAAQRKDLANLKINNPAITLVAISTPDDLFSAIDMNAIKDGFLNRFLPCISDAERKVMTYKNKIPVPESIKAWAKKLQERAGIRDEESSQEQISQIVLTLSDDAIRLDLDFQEWRIAKCNALEKIGMADLPGRMCEIALRVALIAALADNPNAETVEGKHEEWAVWWVKNNYEVFINRTKRTLASSDFEGMKMAALEELRKAGEDGISLSDMFKRKPFSAWRKRDRDEVLNDLTGAGLVVAEVKEQSGRGRSQTVFVAVDD